MNAQENAAAHEVLDRVKHNVVAHPEIAVALANVYKTLCEAYLLRKQAEKVSEQ